MDLTAISMCMEHKLPVVVFDFRPEHNIRRVIEGESIEPSCPLPSTSPPEHDHPPRVRPEYSYHEQRHLQIVTTTDGEIRRALRQGTPRNPNRASKHALVEFLKVECYGSTCDLRDVAAVSVPEPTQLLVKPFDPTTKNSIAKALEGADLDSTPRSRAMRPHPPPAPSAERRKQLSGQVKKMAEDTKVSIRNERGMPSSRSMRWSRTNRTRSPKTTARQPRPTSTS